MMSVAVLKSGPCMTIQDTGRYGYFAQGITTSGALDILCLKKLNCLLGNDINAAAIEMLMLGGSFRFINRTSFAIGGADMSASLNGNICSLYKIYTAEYGDILEFGFAKKGWVGYFAVSGGFTADSVMNSQSTNLKCSFGGMYGRILKTGDVIESGTVSCFSCDKYIADIDEKDNNVIRVVKGPQYDLFSNSAKKKFYEQSYTVSNSYNRMGCRLSGDPLYNNGSTDIISDTVNLGSIQIASDGCPIVMLSDRQTTGGYAKIASVIFADIGKFVQHKPGDKIRFKKISIRKAQQLYAKQDKYIKRLKKDYSGG